MRVYAKTSLYTVPVTVCDTQCNQWINDVLGFQTYMVDDKGNLRHTLDGEGRYKAKDVSPEKVLGEERTSRLTQTKTIMPSENSPGKNTKTYLEEKKIHQGYETFLELYKIGMIYDELLTAYNSGEIIPDSKLYNSMIGLAGREKIMPGDKIWILKLLLLMMARALIRLN